MTTAPVVDSSPALASLRGPPEMEEDEGGSDGETLVELEGPLAMEDGLVAYCVEYLGAKRMPQTCLRIRTKFC